MEDNNKKSHKPLPTSSNVLLSKLYYQYIPYFSKLIIEEINKSSFDIHIDKTNNLKPGVYVISAIIGEENISEKIIMK